MREKLSQIKSLIDSFLNIRSFVIIFALFALIFPTKIPFTKTLNSLIFKTGSHLVSTSEVDDEVVIVHLPPNLITSLTFKPTTVPYFNKFLYRLNLYKPSSMAIILEDFSGSLIKDLYVKVAAQFLRGRSRTIRTMRKNLYNDYMGYDGNLADTIRKNNILIGNIPTELFQRNGAHYSSFDINIPGIKVSYDDMIKWESVRSAVDILAGYEMPVKTPVLQSPKIPFSPYIKSYEILPVFKKESISISHPLIWENQGRIIPDLTTLLYSKLSGSRAPTWNQGNGLKFQYRNIRTDHGGNIQPLLLSSSKEIPQYSLSEILSSKRLNFLRKKTILIGKDNDPILKNIAYTLLSIRSGNFSYTPNWAIFFQKFVIISLLLFLIFVFPKFQSPLDSLLSVGIIFGIATIQTVFLILFKLWIPLTVCISFFISGSFLYILKNSYKNRFEIIDKEKNEALVTLGRIQFENRKFDQAFSSLRQCEKTDEVMDIIYNIGVEYQRRNQFNKAISAFSYIKDIHADYKDAAERMKHLSDFMRGKIKKKPKDGTEDTLDIPHIEINRLVLGRYEIERELGRGAMGIVYLCKDPKIGRSLAVKTLDFSRLIEGDIERAKTRFFQEAKTIGKLNHPNLVMVYDVGEEDQIAFIAMDFVPGKNLNEYTKKKSLLPVHDVFDITARVSEALDYAHGQHVIHRDIKPGNILYSKKLNIVKVTDFGIARMMDSQQTRSDIILGSPSYMSPEQLRSSKIDGRSDIFSLGVTFYQLLTGRYPFEGADLAKITYKITKSKPIDVRELRKDLPEIASKIIDKALQKSPDKRFQTAKEMSKALRKGLEIINKKK